MWKWDVEPRSTGLHEEYRQLRTACFSGNPSMVISRADWRTLVLLRERFQFCAVHIHEDTLALQTWRAVLTNRVWQRYRFGQTQYFGSCWQEILQNPGLHPRGVLRNRLSRAQSTFIQYHGVQVSALDAHLHAPLTCSWIGSQSQLKRDFSSLRLDAEIQQSLLPKLLLLRLLGCTPWVTFLYGYRKTTG